MAVYERLDDGFGSVGLVAQLFAGNLAHLYLLAIGPHVPVAHLQIGGKHLMLLAGPGERLHSHVQRALVVQLRAEGYIVLSLGPEPVLGLQPRRHRGGIYIADRRQIVVGYPLPQRELMGQQHGMVVEHVDDVLYLKVGLDVMDVERHRRVGLAPSERHKYTYAWHYP